MVGFGLRGECGGGEWLWWKGEWECLWLGVLLNFSIYVMVGEVEMGSCYIFVVMVVIVFVVLLIVFVIIMFV